MPITLMKNISLFSSQLTYQGQHDYGTKAYRQKAYTISINYENNSLAILYNNEDTRQTRKLSWDVDKDKMNLSVPSFKDSTKPHSTPQRSHIAW